MTHPSIDRLKELLSVDFESGLLTWRVSKGRCKAGQIAGARHKDGYVIVSVDGLSFGAHRIVWALANGSWPTLPVDHINGLRSDNRSVNLRAVTYSVNSQNRKSAAKHSKSNLLGAHFNKTSGLFCSSINVDGKTVNLGQFKTAEQAHSAYMEAKNRLHAGNGAHEYFNRSVKATCLEELQARAA